MRSRLTNRRKSSLLNNIHLQLPTDSNTSSSVFSLLGHEARLVVAGHTPPSREPSKVSLPHWFAAHHHTGEHAHTSVCKGGCWGCTVTRRLAHPSPATPSHRSGRKERERDRRDEREEGDQKTKKLLESFLYKIINTDTCQSKIAAVTNLKTCRYN